MKKTVIFVLIPVFTFLFLCTCDVVRGYAQLHKNIIRLHVVANSDSEIDQQQKLLVRDAVVDYLQPSVMQCNDQEQAYSYIASQLVQLESVANNALLAAGSQNTASVTLCEEAFDIRYYDTFTLPSGVYSSLRIKIGDAEGKNWWCVVFPSLCLPTDAAGLDDTAAAAGFDEGLRKTITNESGYGIRLYILDLLGRIENFFKTSADDL